MFKRIHWRQYFPFAFIAATAYCIPVIFFLRDANYTQSWLLFLGNLLFLFCIVSFLFYFNKKRHEQASSVTMVAAGHITTLLGIATALITCIILLIAGIPGLLHTGPAGKVLINAPSNTIQGKTNGLVFEVIADVLVGNFSAGSFASILFPFAIKGDQTKESTSKKEDEL